MKRCALTFSSPFSLVRSWEGFYLGTAAKAAFPEAHTHSIAIPLLGEATPCLLNQRQGDRLSIVCPETADSVLVRRSVQNLFPGDQHHRQWQEALTETPCDAEVLKRWEGFRIVQSPDVFPAFVLMITCQQINMKLAMQLVRDMALRFGGQLQFDGHQVPLYPQADSVAPSTVAELRAMKYSERKAEYLLDVARRCASGEWSNERWQTWDNERIIEDMVSARGIGRWTAEWMLLLALGRLDVVPAGDYGVRKTLSDIYFNGVMQPDKTIRELSNRWGAVAGWVTCTLLSAIGKG